MGVYLLNCVDYVFYSEAGTVSQRSPERGGQRAGPRLWNSCAHLSKQLQVSRPLFLHVKWRTWCGLHICAKWDVRECVWGLIECVQTYTHNSEHADLFMHFFHKKLVLVHLRWTKPGQHKAMVPSAAELIRILPPPVFLTQFLLWSPKVAKLIQRSSPPCIFAASSQEN